MLVFSSVVVLSVFLRVFILFLFYSSTLVYSLSLVLFVVVVLFYLVYSNLLAGLMALLLLLVYVGAMIIIIGYICAVSPNIKYEYTFTSFLVLGLICLCFIGVVFFGLTYTYTLVEDLLSPSFILTDLGILDLALLGLSMALVLMFATYSSSLNSSFRSVS